MTLSKEDVETAVCRCGSRNSYVIMTITAILFGMLVKWRCRDCGDVWLTR